MLLFFAFVDVMKLKLKQVGEGKAYFILQLEVHHTKTLWEEFKGGTWHQQMMQRSWRRAAIGMLRLLSYIIQGHPHLQWLGFLTSIINKKNIHRPIWKRQFLIWGSLFLGSSSFFQVCKKNQQQQKKQTNKHS